MLSARSRRLAALLVPRVRARWAAIAAVALAVVLAHSGIEHIDPSDALIEHYRLAAGGDWTRGIGVLQLLVAGGLCFNRTRAMTAAAFAAILLIAIANQWLGDRLGLAPLVLLAWTAVVAWGEMRASAA